MRSRLLISVLLIITLGSCNSGVELENISPKDLLSVSSVISPQDTVFRVYLYQASGLGTIANSGSALVKDAQIIISDGDVADTLSFNNDTERYEGRKKRLTIEPLKAYFLKVQTVTGKVLQASCTIPPAPQTPQITGIREKDDYLFRVSWNNPAAYKYFTLTVIAQGIIQVNSPTGPRPIALNARLLEEIEFPSDEQLNINNYEGIVPRAYAAEHPKLQIYLRQVEENLFNYLKSYQAYENWHSNNRSSLIPNFQEQQPIFSNIVGGAGIFAGCNQSSAEVELE